MNICCHLGEEKAKRGQRVEEWRKAGRKPHEILYVRYTQLSTFTSVTHSTRNFVRLGVTQTPVESTLFEYFILPFE